MRTANDGHDEESWEDPLTAPSDDESTRVFSREASGAGLDGSRALSADGGATRAFRREEIPAPPGSADATQAFARPVEEARAETAQSLDRPAGGTRDTAAPASAADLTQTPGGVRDAGSSGGAAFTRRFVRDRPRHRPSPRASAPRPPVSDPPEEAPGAPVPGPPPVPAPDPLPTPVADDRSGSPRGSYPGAPRPPRRRRPGRRRFRLRWLVTLVLVTVLALPPATWGWVWYTARQDERAPSDAIVVLGASQYNGVPSPVFEARLWHARTLYEEGVAPVIVTVGGKQPDDNFTEAAAGRNWLMGEGVPGDRIVAVEEGRDTLQSIEAVAGLLEENSWGTATIVSDPWHSLRSERMAADFGIDAGTSPSRSGPAVIERRTQLWYITRETAALWYYWIFGDSAEYEVNAA